MKLLCLYSNIFLILILYPKDFIISYISNEMYESLSYPK